MESILTSTKKLLGIEEDYEIPIEITDEEIDDIQIDDNLNI